MKEPNNTTKWTHFWDMHSGGSQKLDWGHIFIEAPEDEAKIIFYNRFGRNPERVTCTCCGEDYSISEHDSLEQATGYHRGCAYGYWNIITGEEVAADVAWKMGEGMQVGYDGGYVERADQRFGLRKHKTLEEYLKTGEAFAIYNKDIKPEERVGNVPSEGYHWID